MYVFHPYGTRHFYSTSLYREKTNPPQSPLSNRDADASVVILRGRFGTCFRAGPLKLSLVELTHFRGLPLKCCLEGSVGDISLTLDYTHASAPRRGERVDSAR